MVLAYRRNSSPSLHSSDFSAPTVFDASAISYQAIFVDKLASITFPSFIICIIPEKICISLFN